MPTLMNMTIEGGDVLPTLTINVNFFRLVSDLTSLPTSGILGGTVDITMVLETETDSNTFFASWFQETGRLHDVDVDVFRVSGTGDKFLTMKITDAQCVQYNISHKFANDDETVLIQSSVLLVQLVSPSITIGQATIQAGATS